MTAAVTNPLLAAALEYAGRGWAVLPLHTMAAGACDCRKAACDSPAKHPRTRDGLKSASIDPEQIERWWSMWPAANIGVRTGAVGTHSFLTVLDVDPRSGGDESFDALTQTHGALPDTLLSLTGGGGRHFLFLGPDPVKCTSHRLGPGLDTRGGGGPHGPGYIVAPPSVHASGRAYAWELSSPRDPATTPPWLVIAANGVTAHAPSPTAEGEAIVDGQAGGGGRKKTLHSIGRTMRARGLTQQEIFAALAAVNAARCQPPLDEKDVDRVAEHAARVAPGRSPEFEPRRLRVVRPGDGSAAAIREPGEDDDDNEWMQRLIRARDQSIKPTFGNISLMLRHAEAWRGRLSYNEQALRPMLDDRPVNDGDVGRMREQMERAYGFAPALEALKHAMLTVSQERPFHPLRSFLATLPAWDGVARIDRVASDLLGVVDPNALTRRILRAWFVSLIARARQPGCKVDTVLVLVGKQGARKSTFFAEIGGEWFCDSHMDLSNKDAYMQVAEAWIYEWGEIERMTAKRGNEEIKSFLTSRYDTFRPPYAAGMVRNPRGCLMVGTTNREEFLTDASGSRRFWIVKVGDEINIDLTREWRAQLLAEALAAHGKGEPWWLDDGEDAERAVAAEEFTQQDTWVDAIGDWLDARSPTAEPVTAKLALSGALRIDAGEQTPQRVQRACEALKALGWEQRRVSVGGFAQKRIWTRRVLS